MRIFSDGGWRAGAIEVAGSDGNGVALGSNRDISACGVDRRRQSRRVRRNQRRRLRGKPAERALIVAMAGRRERRALVVALDAERCGVAESRLQVGDDLGRVGLLRRGAAKA